MRVEMMYPELFEVHTHLGFKNPVMRFWGYEDRETGEIEILVSPRMLDKIVNQLEAYHQFEADPRSDTEMEETYGPLGLPE